MTTSPHRYCVVTPYYKEERALLDRCIASVRRQSPPVDHILIADGFPQDWLDTAGVRHIKLDRAHGDYGNAARGAAALLAIAEGYRGIAFLDADNWYDDDHIATCIAEAEAAESEPAYVIAQRRFCRPDASMIIGTPADAPHSPHVDTNCYLFLPGAFSFLHRWCTMPNALSAYGDQMFVKILRAAALPSVLVPRRTVNYLCLSEQIYLMLGEAVPPGSKPPVLWAGAQAWIGSLTEDGRRHLEAMTGLTLAQIDPIFAAPVTTPETAAVAPATTLSVEIPGSARPAAIRRIEADVASYKRIFIEGLYNAASLPDEASLIVDLAAGAGMSALWLHLRYPQARMIALEADAESFAVLSANLSGRPGCEARWMRLTPTEPHRESESDFADASELEVLSEAGDCPELSWRDFLKQQDVVGIDVLRLTQPQWETLTEVALSVMRNVRVILIEGPEGVERMDGFAEPRSLRAGSDNIHHLETSMSGVAA